MPETSADIRISAQGGEQAASELNKVAGGIAATGDAANNTAPALGKVGKVETAGIRLFSHELFYMIPGFERLAPLARILSAEIRVLMASMGALATGLSIGLAAVAALTIGWIAHKKATDEANKSTQASVEANWKLIDSLDELKVAQGNLPDYLQKLYDSTKKLNNVDQERNSLLDTARIRHIELALAKETDAKAIARLNKEKDELIAKGIEQSRGYKDLSDGIAKETKAAEDETEKNKKVAASIDDMKKSADEWGRAQKRAAEEAARSASKFASSVNNIVRPALDDWMQQTGILYDTTDKNLSRTQKRWHMLANGIIEELARLETEAVAKKFFVYLTGGTSDPAKGIFGAVAKGLGLSEHAYGGVVPGPEGSPQLILAHGGESVTNQKGRGGSGGSPSIVYNNNFTGGIGGLDYRSQRNIARQSRRLVRSVGELPAV